MKNLFLLTFLISLGYSNILDAQTQTREMINSAYQLDEHIKRNDKGMSYMDSNDYEGSPYENPVYRTGNIYKGSDLFANNVALRYNVFADEIEVKESLGDDDNDARLLTKSPDMYVKIEEDIFVFVPFNGSVEDGGYFHVMFEGQKVDLYKKLVKEFTEERKASSSIVRTIPAKFLDRPVFFLVTKSGRFYELPQAKSEMLSVFGAKEKELQEFVNKHRLDIKSDADLKSVIKYYDKL